MTRSTTPGFDRMREKFGPNPRNWPCTTLIGMSRAQYSEFSGVGRGRLRKLIAAGLLDGALHADRSIDPEAADAILRNLPRVDLRAIDQARKERRNG